MVHREDEGDTEDDDEGRHACWPDPITPSHSALIKPAAIKVCLDGSGETAAACLLTGNSSSDS